MKEKILFIGALIALATIVIKYLRTKDLKHLYIAIVLIGTMLWWYPFLLPPEAGFAVWSALGVWIAFSELSRKKRDSSLTLLALILIVFTIVFLMKTLIEMKVI